MRKALMIGFAVCGTLLLAIGSSPRYIEELRIGGGYGEPVDGGADFDRAGNLSTDGVVAASGVKAEGGAIEAGKASAVRGALTAWDGTGGNAPGTLKLASPNGTLYYLFSADEGTLRVSPSLPSSNSSGTVVGGQAPLSVLTIPANDATPSVAGGVVFQIPGTWMPGHNITMFSNGSAGQIMLVLGGDSDCTVTDAGHLKLAGDWTASANQTLMLVFDGTDWREIARSGS